MFMAHKFQLLQVIRLCELYHDEAVEIARICVASPNWLIEYQLFILKPLFQWAKQADFQVTFCNAKSYVKVKLWKKWHSNSWFTVNHLTKFFLFKKEQIKYWDKKNDRAHRNGFSWRFNKHSLLIFNIQQQHWTAPTSSSSHPSVSTVATNRLTTQKVLYLIENFMQSTVKL